MNCNSIHIIPSPKAISVIGERFRLGTGISGDFESCRKSFAEICIKAHGINITDGDDILLKKDSALRSGEYRINACCDKVELTASDEDGMSYALSTLLQMITPDGDKISLPSVEIADRPDCEYRCLMIDLARKWHPFETLLGYVDLCYLYKVKFLHLHFVDTPSYTLPSSEFPKLPTPDRHYSKEQIAALNEYARSRNVEIIPEIEVPGHAKPMVIAYPELFADTPVGESKGDSYALFFGNIKSNIVCAGKPGIMDTLKRLTKEVISMFPYSRYLHIGGDEAAIGEWENCAECAAYMKKNQIDGVRPLYTDFIRRMTDMVLELGKTPIVWEGFPKEGSELISKKVVVTAWESYYQLAPELIEGGFNITNSSWQPLYCVPKGVKAAVPEGRWSALEVLDWNIYTWRNWNKKTAAYEKPIVVEPTDQVLGATFCAWEDDYNGEIIPVRENLAAMSEKTWNINSTLTHEDFTESLSVVIKLAERLTV